MDNSSADRVQVTFDFSCKSWVGTAAQLKKNALADQLAGNHASAFRNYSKHRLKKHPDCARMDPSTRAEFLAFTKDMSNVLNTMAKVKALRDASKPPAVPPKSSTSSSSIQHSATTPQRQQQSTPETMPCQHFLDYFIRGIFPNVLIIDIREYSRYVDLHLAGVSTVHIPPQILAKDRITALEILNKLPKSPRYHVDNFAQRHMFSLIVCMDEHSTQPGQTAELRNLVYALNNDASGSLPRKPALLAGGFQAWRNIMRTQSIRLPLLIDGDVDGKAVFRKPGGNDGSADQLSQARLVNNVRYPVQQQQAASQVPQIVRSTTDYISKSTNGNMAATPFAYAQQAPPMTLQTAVSSVDKEPDSPAAKFDSPFFNFATANGIASHGRHNFVVPQQQSYYPDAPAAPLSTPAPRTTLPALDSRVQQPLSMPMELPRTTLSSTLTPLQTTLPPPLPRKVFKNRAPSPPSPGNASSSLTIHSYIREDMLVNLMGSWSAAGGSSGRGFVGLKNLGNTCFMNSMIQCLIATRPLSLLFYDGSYKKLLNVQNPLSTKGQLAQSFSQLLTMINREENGVVVSPSVFKECVGNISAQFRGSEQHDAQEFLAFLLDGLHEDLNQGLNIRGGHGYVLKQIPPGLMTESQEEEDRETDELIASSKAWLKYLARNDSPLVHWFQGLLKSDVQCTVCRKTSSTYNPFMYLSLPIPKQRKTVTLSDCLDEFTKKEILEDSDSWKCPQCKCPRRAEKRLSIAKLPGILLIHLKRFSFEGHFRDKIDTMVDYPMATLDLTRYVSPAIRQDTQKRQSSTFDLYAVSNHFGGLNGGHYTATVRHAARRAWYYFDDSRVSDVGSVGDLRVAPKVVTKAAYSLFYVSNSLA